MTNPDTIFLDGRLLEIFCAAAEELHFGRAAARVFMSQPPFSQQIKRLERLVEAELFTRTTRSVRLTPTGEVMYARAKQIARDTRLMLRAVRQAARGEAGSLAIGLNLTAAWSPLTDALYRYRVAHPEIELDLQEMNSNAMQAALRARTIDVALMRPLPTDADVQTVEVFREPMLLAIRRDHPWATRPRVTVGQAAELPLVGYAQSVSPYFRQMLQQMFSSAGKRPRVVQESLLPTVLTLVEAGVGAAIVPWTITRWRGESLAFLPLAGRSQPKAIILLASLRARHNPAVEDFIATMRQAQRIWAGGTSSVAGSAPRTV